MAATLDNIRDELKEANLTNEENVKETRTLAERLSETKLTEAFRGGLQKFLGLDFVENFKKLGSKMQDIGKSIASKLDSMIVSPVKDLFSGFFDAIKFGIALIGGVVAMTAFLDGWKKAEDWFGSNANFGDKIAAGLASVLGVFLGLEGEQTKNIAVAISDSISFITDNIKASLDSIIPGLKNLVSGIFNGDAALIGDGIRGIVTGVTDFFLNLTTDLLSNFLGEEKANAIMQPIKDLVQTLLDIGGNLVGIVSGIFGILTGEEGAWGNLGTSIMNLGANILSAIDKVITAVLAIFNFDDEYAAFKEAIVNMWNTTGEIITGIKDSILNSISAIAKFFYNSETGDVFGINFMQLGSDIIGFYAGFYGGIWNKIKEFGSFLYNSETGDVFGINFGLLISDIGSSILDSAMALPTKIGNMFIGLWNKITGVFENLINGIIDKVNYIPGVDIEKVSFGSTSAIPEVPAAAITKAEASRYSSLNDDQQSNGQLAEEQKREISDLKKQLAIYQNVTNVNNNSTNVINRPVGTVTP